MQAPEIMLTGLVWLLVLAAFFYNRHRVTREGFRGKPSSQPHRRLD
jgi:hypothetical protein